MKKRHPIARAHSQCGHPLDDVVFCEVIPASYYHFSDKEYKEEDSMPEYIPEILCEYRHNTCMKEVSGADLEYFIARTKGETDSG